VAKAVVVRGQTLRLQPADHLTQLLFAELFDNSLLGKAHNFNL
jgi:hypothetical protein